MKKRSDKQKRRAQRNNKKKTPYQGIHPDELARRERLKEYYREEAIAADPDSALMLGTIALSKR